MTDFKPKSAEKISERKKEKRIVFLVVIGILIIAGAVLIYNFGYLPSTGNYTIYTQEQIELIANNSYPAMRDVILTHLPVVTGCIATETDNLSVCDLLDTEERKEKCQRQNRLYLLFTGNCEGLRTHATYDFEVPLCESLRSDSCDALSGENKKMCESMLNLNIAKCVSVSSNFNMSSEDCQETIYEYGAIKENNINHCDNIPTFYKTYQCKAFVSGTCESFLNNITNDWLYFSLSRNLYEDRTDTSLCGNIIYPEIRNQCYDTSISYQTAIQTTR